MVRPSEILRPEIQALKSEGLECENKGVGIGRDGADQEVDIGGETRISVPGYGKRADNDQPLAKP